MLSQSTSASPEARPPQSPHTHEESSGPNHRTLEVIALKQPVLGLLAQTEN